MIGGPVTFGGGRGSFSSRFSIELVKPRCAPGVHRHEGLDREACRRHLQRCPEVAITVKGLTSPRGVRRSIETTGWVAWPAGGSSGR
jgi:hypothetical protein